MKQQAAEGFTFRGITITIKDDDAYVAEQSNAAASLTLLDFRREPERLLGREELSEYRSAVGKLLWLASQTRPDLAVGTSFGAQRSAMATVQDARTLNVTLKQAKNNSDFALIFRRRPVSISAGEIAEFSDSAFANADVHKSQYGMVGSLADVANSLLDEDYNHTTPSWCSPR